jgi:hypothetical protein
MCRKWHIQGHCFSTCNFCENHVPQNHLSDELKTRFKGWMDKIRRSSGSAWSVGLGLSGAWSPPKPPDKLPPAPNLLREPNLQNPFTQSTTSIPSQSKKVSFNEADYNSIVDDFIAAKDLLANKSKQKSPSSPPRWLIVKLTCRTSARSKTQMLSDCLIVPRALWVQHNC